MLTIQQAGMEILGNNPGYLYFFCGTEYGVKNKYIEHLSTLFNHVMEVDSLDELFTSFNKKRLISTSSTLYICRYDFDFLKKLDVNRVKKQDGCCVVAVYEDEKSFSRLNKVFPDNVVRFDAVSDKFVLKYLSNDFPDIDERYLNLVAVSCTGGYGQAKIVCSQFNCIRNSLSTIEDEKLLSLAGLGSKLTEQNMMKYAAARNFSGVMKVVDSFEGDVSNLINGMCHVAIELDKAMDSRSPTEYSKYVKFWSREDVYNFFDQAYTQTLSMRSSLSTDAYSVMVYIASLLRFNKIPSVEQMSCPM